MLDKKSNQPVKSRTKYCIEINDDSGGMYDTYSQIKFKTSMVSSSLYLYSGAYILANEAISIERVAAPADSDNDGKEVVLKDCAPLTDCISEINNIQINNAKYIDVIMPMCNLIEYSHNYPKTSESLLQYYRTEPALTAAGVVANFHAVDNSALSKFKQKITDVTAANGRKNVKIMVPLKYLGNFWRALEMPLINCEIILI